MYPMKLTVVCMATSLMVLSAVAQAAPQSGMRILRDPVSGELRAPTPEEFTQIEAEEGKARAALRGANRKATSARPANVSYRLKGGGVGVRPGEESTMFTVVKQNADGTLTTQCVTGQAAADAVMAAPAAATSVAHEEHSYETK